MPVQIASHRLRIAFDIAQYGKPVVEKRSGETPQIWRGNDLRIEVVVMDNGDVLDVGNLASLTLEVRPKDDIDGTPAMQKTVSSGDLDNTVTDPTWEDDTKEHAVFEFTDTETNLASPGDDYGSNWEQEYYIVLHGVTTGGNIITYQTGVLIFREDGSGSAGTPPTNDPNYYTMGQVDAAFLPLAGGTMTGDLTLAGAPTSGLHAATKDYVDAATAVVTTPSADGQALVTAANYAAMRALLDLEPGTDFLSVAAIAAAYQPLAASLTSLAGITPSANGLSLLSAANYAAMRTLLDLEVGTDFLSPSVITTALDLKAPLASPSFTGALTAGGGILNSDGTAGAPAYSFTSETDMGIRRSGAGIMAHVFSGVDRLLIGESGNDLLAELPDYNCIIDPSSSTNGRGNLGLFDVTGFGTDASGVLALGPVKNAPSAGNATDILLWQDINATTTNPELVLNSNGNRLFLGEYIGIGKSASPTHPVEIDANSCWFTSDVPADIYMFGFSSGAADGLDLFLGRGRGTEAAKNQVQSGDALANITIQGAHNSGSMGTAAKLAFTTTEAFDAVNGHGTKLTLQTCLTGSVTLSDRLVIDGAGNWLFGGAAAPASLVNGHVLANGTAPSADPTNAAVIVPVSGELQYRTSAASEGAGQMNRLHNRGAETEGSGTDTLSGSFTDVDFGAGALTLTLPAGTAFQVFAMIEFTAGSGADESVSASAQLVRGTSTVVINPHAVTIARDASFDRNHTLTLMGVVTGIGNATLKLQALSADGVTVARARIGYVRLY